MQKRYILHLQKKEKKNNKEISVIFLPRSISFRKVPFPAISDHFWGNSTWVLCWKIESPLFMNGIVFNLFKFLKNFTFYFFCDWMEIDTRLFSSTDWMNEWTNDEF